ncbi:hypothetical protein V3W47_19025 [Deinococcus sp. YIM 134068]|uniref:hypothetical protein n=1 Tax=Deinococcus lichenicola TaxID=3118910 RepID=UPI002F93E0A8
MSKKKKNDGTVSLVGFAVVGLLAVGGVMAWRKQQETMPAGSAEPETTTTTDTTAAGTTVGNTIQFGVNAGLYYPIASPSFTTYYGQRSGGL